MTDTDALRERIHAMIAASVDARAAMRADKPTVTDGHSDGKRVRYVRHEAAERALLDVLALLDGSR